jgi:peptide/nickel transport system substrate-binding protein
MQSPRNKRGITPRLSIVAAIAAVALSLSACAAGEETATEVDQTFVVGSQMSSFPSLDTGAITLAGYEGQRLIGNLIYEGLTKRDVSDPDAPAGVGAALAESWEAAEDGLSYTFTLRDGVTFHDGTAWDADAAIYNLDRYMNEDDPNYVASIVTYYTVLTYVESVEKVDDMTIKFNLEEPFAYFLADLYNVYFASPASLDADGPEGQASNPVGTGPFVFDTVDGNESISFTKNDEWCGEGPLLDRFVVELIPDAAARVAALRAGRVDWIEAVNPDDIAGLESAGFQVATKKFDWEWSWQLMMDQAPFDNILVRQAMNFAIDREAIAEQLLGGTAVPAYQVLAEASLFYDDADNIYEYDPEKATDLLAEAGYADGLEINVGYISSGSGSMQPKIMNEALQSQLAEVGITVNLEPVEFAAMYSKLAEGNTGWQAYNASRSLEQPSSWGSSFSCEESRSSYCSPEVDALLAEALVTVDDDARAGLITDAMSQVTEDAAWMFVVNDSAPRAMAPGVAGYEQPMSWWVEFNDVYME